MDFSIVTADTREALYNEVWSEPVTIVAKRYGMSDNGLRKHFKKLEIPLPPAGYWAKKRAGKIVPRSALPKVTGELRKHVRNYFIKFKTEIDKLSDAELSTEQEELSLLSFETKQLIGDICSQIQVKSQLRSPHHLITQHQEELANRKKRGKELKRVSFSTNYYGSGISEYRMNKTVLPLTVSGPNINRAYRILDTIIRSLEEMEGDTRVGSNQGNDEAYFTILYSHFEFELKENRKQQPPKKNDESQPRLILSMVVKRWLNNSEQIELRYTDKDGEPLESQVGKIIYNMFVIANKQRALAELDRRKEKRVWEERERQRRLEQMRNGQLEEVKLLHQATADWYKAEQIRRFAESLECKINEVGNEQKRDKLSRWLEWARDKADWLDPLTAKEDKLLGKGKHLFDLIEHSNV